MNARPIRRLTLALAAAAVCALPLAAEAGPPLLCHPHEIGSAKSLPMGKDKFEKASGYDAKNVVDDTLSLLKTERSALVRMETLRRATVYLRENPRGASELLGKLAWIALDGESASERPNASEAWFNAGVLAASLAQMGIDVDFKVGVKDGIIGYAWMTKALAEGGENPEMEFAAALMTAESPKLSRTHLARAVTRAKEGSNLAVSIERNNGSGAKTIEQLRKELAQYADASGNK